MSKILMLWQSTYQHSDSKRWYQQTNRNLSTQETHLENTADYWVHQEVLEAEPVAEKADYTFLLGKEVLNFLCDARR